MDRVYGLPIRLSGQPPGRDRATRPSRLAIPGRIADEIERHLRASLPNEGCGMLAAVERDDGLLAVRFYPGSNEDASPLRYTMDPREVIAALRDIDDRGWTLGAIVHSHPAGPATPSATDLAEAHYPDALMVIADLSGPSGRYRAWSVGPERLVEEADLDLRSGGRGNPD